MPSENFDYSAQIVWTTVFDLNISILKIILKSYRFELWGRVNDLGGENIHFHNYAMHFANIYGCYKIDAHQ